MSQLTIKKNHVVWDYLGKLFGSNEDCMNSTNPMLVQAVSKNS